jgi:hypothetical protein
MKKMNKVMSKKLSKLRSITPTPETLSSIKATIDARILRTATATHEKYDKKKRSLLVSPYIQRALYGMSFFLFLFAFHLENPYIASQVLERAQVAYAPHAHAKAAVTLGSLESLTKNNYLFANAHDYEAVMRTVSLNQQTLDTLSLHGEKDLYSMDECLSDYTQYYHLLVALDKKLEAAQKKKSANHDTLQALQNQVHEALEEAEDRLGSYPEDMENK